MYRLRLAALLLLILGGTASADTIKLANGDTLTGEIVRWAVDYVVIDHPQLGEIQLSLDQLAVDTGEPPSPGLFGSSFLRGWSRRIDLGINGRQGSTDTRNITAGIDFNYADEFKRWEFRGRYFFNSTSDGDDEDNNARLDLRRDWLFPGSRFFAFGSFRYQFDQFENWKHRTVFAAGPGIHLVQREDHVLDFRVGPSFTREYEGTRKNRGEVLFALDYDWKISERNSFSFQNDYFLAYTPDSGEFRNLTLAEWRIALLEKPALSLTIGGSNEYDSDPDPGDDANDLRYYLTVGVDF